MSAAPLPKVHSSSRRPPALRNGDRLTRTEFERRYAGTPGVDKAELIEGVVYMPSPVRYASHGAPHSILATVLNYYVARTPGLRPAGDNGTVRLDNDNAVQPDLFLLLPERVGGKARVDEDDFVSGPPALVCEIAASSVSIDLHDKKTVYRRNGVQEYLAWRVEDAAVDWFELVAGDYVLRPVGDSGLVASAVFPGLWLDVKALLAGDLPALLGAVERGAASGEHAAFVQRLRA